LSFGRSNFKEHQSELGGVRWESEIDIILGPICHPLLGPGPVLIFRRTWM
jgi:hypothetical protein